MNRRALIDLAILPALSLLPGRMTSPQAIAMLVAIADQESDLKHRRQVKGPARSFWQFEQGGGVAGVLKHPQTKMIAAQIVDLLVYPTKAPTIHAAIEHNDVLAACFARLLLWTVPQRLPEQHEVENAYAQYILAWQPGKPHPKRWPSRFEAAWPPVRGSTG